MTRRWPTLFDIARTMRTELTLRPGRPGARNYYNKQLNVALELWHDGDEFWKLTIKRLNTLPDVSALAFCRAAFQVPEEAVERQVNRREISDKTGYVLHYQGVELSWREVIVEVIGPVGLRPRSERLSQISSLQDKMGSSFTEIDAFWTA